MWASIVSLTACPSQPNVAMVADAPCHQSIYPPPSHEGRSGGGRPRRPRCDGDGVHRGLMSLFCHQMGPQRSRGCDRWPPCDGEGWTEPLVSSRFRGHHRHRPPARYVLSTCVVNHPVQGSGPVCPTPQPHTPPASKHLTDQTTPPSPKHRVKPVSSDHQRRHRLTEYLGADPHPQRWCPDTSGPCCGTE